MPDVALDPLRRQWWIPLVCALVAAGLAVAAGGGAPSRVSGRLIVGLSPELDSPGLRASGASALDATVVTTLADVLGATDVRERAAAAIGLAGRGAEYAVVGTPQPESLTVDVSVEGPDGAQARRLARGTIAEARTKFRDLYPLFVVDVLERPRADGRVGSTRAADGFVAGLLGLVLGLALVVAAPRARRRS